MLAYAIYALRYALWVLRNLHRRLRKVPDYVVFILEGAYPELRPPRRPFWQRRLVPSELSLQDLAERFRMVAGDPRVKGVVLHLRPLRMPFAQLQTLRDLIWELKKAGKRVVAWSHSYESSNYYVACACDEILLQPGGGLAPLGLRQSFLFLADALDRIGVKAEIMQISPYKTGADILMRSRMSDEAREMISWLMDDLYAQFLQGIAEGRGVDEGSARALVDQSPYTDLKAKAAGAIDTIIGEEDLTSHLGSKAKQARLMFWEEAHKRLLRLPITRPGRYVALLRIEGDIVDGRSQRLPVRPPVRLPFILNDRAGDLSVVQEARQLLKDKRAAAIVVYVDSGGGSATASEAMAAALQKIAAQKPLVVAMGPVAASGGYYISTPAKWIMAQAGTLTGSIGVLHGKIVSAGLLEKLLFHREMISRGQRVTLYDPGRPFSEEERQIVWEAINRMYDVFLDRVASSRQLTREAVDAVGGGRVWTGRQALERRLIDELGGLEKALAKAKELAGLDPQAAVREVRPGRRPLAPLPEPVGLISYALEGIRMLSGGKALYLCPLMNFDLMD